MGNNICLKHLLKCFNRNNVLIPFRRLFLSICFISLLAFCQLFFHNSKFISQSSLSTTIEINKQQNISHLPNFLIIGVRKGGTRALLDALALHPNIKIARHEVHFFDKERNFRRGLDWYRDQMPSAGQNDIIIEKTPAYFTANPKVPERVFNFNPKMKFILIVRSPIIRTVSDFTQILQTKKERNKPTINFEKMSFIKNCNGSIQLNKRFKPIRNSLYAEHLNRWLNYFPLEQFLILDGDKFIDDPLSQLKISEHFLGLEPSINSNQLIFNKEKNFFCFRKNINTTVHCLGKSKGRKHIKISTKFRRSLIEHFRPYNQKFFSLINREFQSWE